MDRIKISVAVVADPARRETVVRRSGDRCPISCIYAATPDTLAAAFRDAAAYFLDLAGQIPGQSEGLAAQAAVMQEEHKSIFAEVIA